MKHEIAGIVAILMSACGLYAGTVSININPADQSVQAQMASTDIAGAPGVAAGNWNSLSVTGNGNGYVAGSMNDLMDDSGADTGMDATAGNIPSYNAFTADFAGYGWTGADLTMHTGGMNDSSQIMVNNISYSLYDIYVYLGGGSNGGNAGGVISVSGTGGLDASQYQYFGYSWSGGNTYTQVTSTNSVSPSGGNYVEFTENTASSFTVSYMANPSSAIYDGGITGIQIVAVVPEPAPPALASLGVGSLFFAGFRRRRTNHREITSAQI